MLEFITCCSLLWASLGLRLLSRPKADVSEQGLCSASLWTRLRAQAEGQRGPELA